MQSLQGQSFYQMSGGLELGSRYVTIRANHYWPLTDAQRFGEVRTVSVRNTSSISNSERTSYRLEIGPGPYGPSNVTNISAFATTNRSSSISTRIIQTTAIHGLFEEALEGWDLDASFLMPGLDRYTDLRLITGFYRWGFAA